MHTINIPKILRSNSISMSPTSTAIHYLKTEPKEFYKIIQNNSNETNK